MCINCNYLILYIDHDSLIFGKRKWQGTYIVGYSIEIITDFKKEELINSTVFF